MTVPGFLKARFTVRIGSKKQGRKTLKTCSLVRKAYVKLRLRKAWFLKRLVSLKRNQVFTLGK
jgi:hypothetical protein